MIIRVLVQRDDGTVLLDYPCNPRATQLRWDAPLGCELVDERLDGYLAGLLLLPHWVARGELLMDASEEEDR